MWLLGVGVLLGLLLLFWARARKSYGGLRAAASGAFRAEREELKRARKEVRDLEKQVRSELRDPERALANAERAYEARIREARKRLEGYLEPGNGETIVKFNGLKLCAHRIVQGRASVPTHGVQARVETTGGPTGIANLYLSWPDRAEEYFPFSLAADENGKQKVSDPEVRNFANAINKVAHQEAAFREQLPDLVREARAELEQAEAATGDVEAARAQLEQQADGNATVGELDAARERLAGVEADFRAQTSPGDRPLPDPISPN